MIHNKKKLTHKRRWPKRLGWPNPKNDDYLTQKMKTTWPKKWGRHDPKIDKPYPKNEDNLTQKSRQPDPKIKTTWIKK